MLVYFLPSSLLSIRMLVKNCSDMVTMRMKTLSMAIMMVVKDIDSHSQGQRTDQLIVQDQGGILRKEQIEGVSRWKITGKRHQR